MSPPDVFEKGKFHKQRMRLLREKAVVERDLMRLQQKNQQQSFLWRSVFLFTVMFLGCMLVSIFTARYFYGLMNIPPNCINMLFDASNFFTPYCIKCQTSFQLLKGQCLRP